MKKNFFFLPLSIPVFFCLFIFPFLVLATLSLLEISPGPALQKTLGMPVLHVVTLYEMLLITAIFNIPVYEFKSARDSETRYAAYLGGKYQLPVWHGHNTIVSINFGGCIVAIFASVLLALQLNPLTVLLSIAVVSLGVFLTSRPSRSIGFYVPPYVPPVLAVVVSLVALHIYAGDASLFQVGRLGFVSGVFGTLIGTSLLNVTRMHKIGTSFISVGGIGSFDGIFLSGVLATIAGCVIASL